MRVLGVDPGTHRMGICILDANGNHFQLVAFETITFAKALTLPEKLKKINDRIREMIERFSPDVMALENVFFGKSIQVLVRVGEARASAMLAAAEKKIPVIEYPPARVKEAVSGNGRASKIQIQQMVKHRLQMKTVPPTDAADALAVALCHVQTHNVRILIGKNC